MVLSIVVLFVLISFELLSTYCTTAVHLFVCCMNKRQKQKVVQNNKECIHAEILARRSFFRTY